MFNRPQSTRDNAKLYWHLNCGSVHFACMVMIDMLSYIVLKLDCLPLVIEIEKPFKVHNDLYNCGEAVQKHDKML